MALSWAYAQAPDSRPQFEVASIKPATGVGMRAIRATPGRVNVDNMPLRRLIFVAYKAQDFQITGGPAWINTDLWSIEATAEGSMRGDRFPLMLQTLLEDRFQLKIHRETREGSVYELTVLDTGSKLRPTKEGSCIPIELKKPTAVPDPSQPPVCGGRNSTATETGAESLESLGMPLTDQPGVPFQSLTGELSMLLGRTVINKTGLTGRFDFHLEWTPDAAGGSGPAASNDLATLAAADAGGTTIFTAVQMQLGLKLKSAKGPVEVLVVDHAEKPTGN
jgi:uncharacterized protein (TIGR03435 family)